MFDETKLAQALSALPGRHQIAFAAACCERLIPNYHAFALMEDWGDPALLRQALDEIWSDLEGETFPKSSFRVLIAACKAVTPDTEDFTSFLTGAALNAAAAIIYTLESCLDGDAELVAMVGRVAVNTIDEYLSLVNDPIVGSHAAEATFDTWLQQAPLMIAELEKQQQDLVALQSHATLDLHFLMELRQSSRVAGLQPFARGLIKMANPEVEE